MLTKKDFTELVIDLMEDSLPKCTKTIKKTFADTLYWELLSSGVQFSSKEDEEDDEVEEVRFDCD